MCYNSSVLALLRFFHCELLSIRQIKQAGQIISVTSEKGMSNKFFGYFSSISNSNFKGKKEFLKVAFNVNSLNVIAVSEDMFV